MKSSNNTILITGGSAGIGFALAQLLIEKGNKVIITGRDKDRLHTALEKLPGAAGIASDVSKQEDTEALVANLQQHYPALNLVINNAGRAILYDIGNSENAFDKAQDEMLTNYLSIIRLNEQLLPHLKLQPEAAIVNVSSVVAFVPGSLATYSASKAALHSYTQALRMALAATSVKVFELMPPLVDTEFSAPINGKTGISPALVAQGFIDALEKDDYEIRVGNTQYIYDLFRKSPEEALKVLNAGR